LQAAVVFTTVFPSKEEKKKGILSLYHCIKVLLLPRNFMQFWSPGN